MKIFSLGNTEKYETSRLNIGFLLSISIELMLYILFKVLIDKYHCVYQEMIFCFQH